MTGGREADVGPLLRQLLTRAEDLFGGPFVLALADELARRQVPEGAVWVVHTIVEPPAFEDRLRLGERGELVDVQTLIAETPVKRFNEGIFHGFARPNWAKQQARAQLT